MVNILLFRVYYTCLTITCEIEIQIILCSISHPSFGCIQTEAKILHFSNKQIIFLLNYIIKSFTKNAWNFILNIGVLITFHTDISMISIYEYKAPISTHLSDGCYTIVEWRSYERQWFITDRIDI